MWIILNSTSFFFLTALLNCLCNLFYSCCLFGRNNPDPMKCLCFKVKTLVKTAREDKGRFQLLSLTAGFWRGGARAVMSIGSGRSVLKGPLCWQRSAQASCLSCRSSLSRQHHEKHNTVFKLLYLTPLRVFSVRVIRVDG